MSNSSIVPSLSHQELSNRLETKEGELRIDSRLVSDGLGVSNHTYYRNNILVKYEGKFAILGLVLKTTLESGEIVWYLNEDQINFAGTLARNSDQAVDFKLKLVQAFKLAREKKQSQEYPRQIIRDIPANPTAVLVEKANIVLDGLFSLIDHEIRTGMKIEAICKVDPSLREMLEPFKPKLLLDAPLLSPTDIGKILEDRDGIKRSGIAINKLLISKNLQVATGDKKLAYKAIGQGIEFSKVIADTAQGHGKTVQSLRWYESVIDLLN
jgi:hypothetical protein